MTTPGRCLYRARILPAAGPPNSFVECIVSKLRDDCLDEQMLDSLDRAMNMLRSWRHDYNHRALSSKKCRSTKFMGSCLREVAFALR